MLLVGVASYDCVQVCSLCMHATAQESLTKTQHDVEQRLEAAIASSKIVLMRSTAAVEETFER